jgi:transcription antitermination factor NusG
MEYFWYTIHSHPHKEDLLWEQLLARGIETFYPRIRVQVVNPRARKIRPYFPGYLFIRANLEEVSLSSFQWMPYATGLVSFGGEPAVVPDYLVIELKKRMGDITSVETEPSKDLKEGSRVVVTYGPFAGYEAIFNTRISGSKRVQVLLQMLGGRKVPLELSVNHIEKKSSLKN